MRQANHQYMIDHRIFKPFHKEGLNLPNALISKFVELKDNNEQAGMLWATAYGFFIMFSYYILRAVRDEISSADRGNLQILWTVVFFAMLVAVPLYSWITSKFSRGVFVPLANRFFIACLVGFWLCLVLMPEDARPWIDRVFYVWTSVFALFVVTVFWVWWLTVSPISRENDCSHLSRSVVPWAGYWALR